GDLQRAALYGPVDGEGSRQAAGRHVMRARLLVAAVAIALGLAQAPASAEPLKIRIAYSSTTGQLTMLMTQVPRELLQHWGKSYVVEPMFIQGSGPMLTAVAAK